MDEVLQALASELSLPRAGTMTVIVVRVVVAALLGGIIGWEREQKGRAAGLKTHILVAVGSALFVLAPYMAGIDGGPDALRVSLFAQELGSRGGVSPKKLAQRLAALT